MKLLLLNSVDTQGGAARAAYRLHKALLDLGISSQMLVQRRLGQDPTVHGPCSKLDRALSLIRPYLDRLPLRLYNKKSGKPLFCPAWLPDFNLRAIKRIDPDIVHLHWICDGFLRIETIRRLKTPVVWTLHDMWPFTGGCHYDSGCGRYESSCGPCPKLGTETQKDLSHWIWKRKEKAFKTLNLTVVAPSRWLGACALRSSLFRKKRIEVIPNGLDLNTFRPVDKLEARKILGLPTEKRLILFGAEAATQDRRKGVHILFPALEHLATTSARKDMELMVFGAFGPPETNPEPGMKSHYLGRFHDDISLCLLYSAADVFVAPSMQENLSNTVMEAMACGTPCVAFEIGGMPDLIDQTKNGYLAKPFSKTDLSAGIKWILNYPEPYRLCDSARKKAERCFNVHATAKKYIALYSELLGNVNPKG